MANEDDVCTGCGMSRSDWKGNDGRGYAEDGIYYCCQECAEGSECTCGT